MLLSSAPQNLIIYVVFTTLAALLAAGQALYVARQSKFKGYRYFLGFLLSVFIWSGATSFQVLAKSFELQLLFTKIIYLGVVTLPVCWVLFIAIYTDSFKFLFKIAPYLWLMSALTLTLAWTNDLHSLMWAELSLDSSSAYPVMLTEHGVWFDFVHTPFSYALTGLSSFMLLWAMIRSQSGQRIWLFALGIAQLLPIFANLAYLFTDLNLDVTPIGLAISSLIIGVVLVTKNHRRSLVAHHTILNNIDDAFFVLNADHELLDLNEAAKKLLHSYAVVGRHISYSLAYFEELLELLSKQDTVECELNGIIYSFSCSELLQPEGHHLLLGRDISQQKQADEKVKQHLRKLEAIVSMSDKMRKIDNLDEVYATVVRSIFDLSKADFCSLLMRHPERDSLIIVLCEGRETSSRDGLIGQEIPKEKSLGWQAIYDNATVHFRHQDQSLEPNQGIYPLEESSEIKEFIAAPIHNKEGEIIGLLAADIELTDAAFDEADLSFIETIAQACGSAVRRHSFLEASQQQTINFKELFTDASRQARELELLNQVSSAVAKELEISEVIRKTVTAIAEVSGYEKVNVYLQTDQKMRLEYQLGYEEIDNQLDVNSGLIGKVVQTSEAQRLCSSEGSSLAVPLLHKGRLMGVLTIETSLYAFNQDDLRFAVQLARQLNIAFEREELYNALRFNEERFQLISNNMQDIIALHRPDGTVEYASPSYEKIYGYTEDTLKDGRFFKFVHPEDRGFLKNTVFSKLLQGKAVKPYQYRMKRASGDYIWIETDVNIIRDAEGTITGYTSSSRDISERKQLQEQMLEGALLYDSLTNLPNRTLFMDRLEQAVMRQERENKIFAVLFIDLDRFKIINDSLGHHVGDQLLIESSSRILSSVRAQDTVARLGGDEFALILNDVTHETAVKLSERILHALAKPYLIDGHPVSAAASIGVRLSDHIGDANELLRTADLAMYHVKANGRSGYAVFCNEMSQEFEESVALELDLRRALAEDEFSVCYQPIVELNTGRVSGFEALVRWQHPKRGFVSPDVFIPIAEELGLVPAIDSWVLATASSQIAVWNKAFQLPQPLELSVNVSTKNFVLANLAERITDVLEASKFDPTLLKLEITETVIMENADIARQVLTELQAKGVTIQIDDFGTGYSSLSYLNKLPLQSLKIDRSFTMSLPGSHEEQAIIASIVALADSLNLDIVAEGIETQAQLEHIQGLDCHYGQGYYFSKPMTPSAVETFYHEAQLQFSNRDPLISQPSSEVAFAN